MILFHSMVQTSFNENFLVVKNFAKIYAMVYRAIEAIV